MNYKQSASKKSKLKRIFKKKKVEGVRQGQELDEVLGYQLERGLHEKKRKGKKKRA